MHTLLLCLENMLCTLAAKVFSGESQRREAGIELSFFEFQTFWFCKQLLESTLAPSCEQTLSKTDQTASKRGSAEIVSSRRSPGFWAILSGQTSMRLNTIDFLFLFFFRLSSFIPACKPTTTWSWLAAQAPANPLYIPYLQAWWAKWTVKLLHPSWKRGDRRL